MIDSTLFVPKNECQKPARLLVVDEDTDIQQSLMQALDDYDFNVTTASDTEKALGLVKEHKFDLVMCEMHAQKIDGIQLARSFCHIHPQMPVVLVSNNQSIDTMRQALNAGASDFVAKPLELSKLPLILQNNIQRKRIETRKLIEQRADVLFKTVKALTSAIDAKSHYTGRHSARVTELCMEIGTEMELDSQAMTTLELAANVHDVGKIGTPDAVLTKPGKLSPDEWTCIKNHATIGADILAGIDELKEVADIVRHHHEHLDGTGYPDGLKGRAIPFLSRVLTVADAFEAMTANRPYRQQCSWEDALAELQRTSGTQFDPQVVNSFARVLERNAERQAPLKKAA